MLKISMLGLGSGLAVFILWRLLSVVFVVTILIVKIAIIAACVMFGIWAFRRFMAAPVRSDTV